MPTPNPPLALAVVGQTTFVAGTYAAFAPLGSPPASLLVVGAGYPNATLQPAEATVVESEAANVETQPVLVAKPHPTLLWEDNRSAATDSVAQVPLDPASGSVVGAGGPVATFSFPLPLVDGLAAASDGSNIVIVAFDHVLPVVMGIPPVAQPFEMEIVKADGTTQMLQPTFPNGTAAGAVDIAYGAGGYLVTLANDSQIVAVRINATTFAEEAAAIVSDGTSPSGVTERSHPKVAFDGTNFLVVWQDGRNATEAIYGAHVTPAGQVIEPQGLRISASPFPQTAPAVAAENNEALVVWRDTRDEATVGDIFGHRLDSTGALAGSDIAVAAAAGDQSAPVVTGAGDGLSFQVAWVDGRTNVSGDIYGTLVGYDGTVRQPAGEPLASALDAETAPALAQVAPGQMILAYVRHDSAVALGTDRVRTRVLSTGETTGKCTSDNDCATLHCTDGVCCNVACDGPCETCLGATPGICTPVLSKIDPDTCSGTKSCNANGACDSVLGQTCAAATDCVSGFCVDGVCCDSACLGACNACNLTATIGACTILPAGSGGTNPSCLPETCNGTSVDCPSKCITSSDCLRPYTCTVDGKCELRTGAACADDHTLESADGTLKDCTPYACEGQLCLSQCNSIEQCAAGALCDDRGVCVAAGNASAASACSASRVGTDRDSRRAWLGAFAAVAALAARRRRRVLGPLRER
jgi:hypothetical protein